MKNRYPFPFISPGFDLLQGEDFYKTWPKKAYHLVRIAEGDEWNTSFNTPIGHYENLLMSLDLINAPAVFQKLVNYVLRDMLYKFV